MTVKKKIPRLPQINPNLFVSLQDQTTYYFAAGPAQLPESVKQRVVKHIHVYPGSAVSILELSHRSAAFEQLLNDINHKLRQLLHLPDAFEILLAHGGATAQFDAVPLNLVSHADKQTPVYLLSGFWSRKAAEVAKSTTNIEQIQVNPDNIDQIVSQLADREIAEVSYIYVTPNETIDGVEYYLTKSIGIPLVADMTSCLLTKKINFDPYGVIFAGAQKTLGIAGLCLVLVRKDLICAKSRSPKWLDYCALRATQSRVNTPPVFAIDMLSLMLDWYLDNGGVDACERAASQRASMIYDVIDQTGHYRSQVPKEWRSRLNIPFQLEDAQKTRQFLQLAEQNGLHGLEGHRSVGGVRASMYAAMPLAGAQRLRQLMLDFI